MLHITNKPAEYINKKRMKDRSRLIAWDAALVTGYVLAFALHIPDTCRIVIGFVSAIILSNCVRNHIAAYKLNGKIY